VNGGYQEKKENDVDPSQYQNSFNLNLIGKDARSVILKSNSRKPLWKTDDTPGPGVYDTGRAESAIRHRVVSPIIKNPPKN